MTDKNSSILMYAISMLLVNSTVFSLVYGGILIGKGDTTVGLAVASIGALESSVIFFVLVKSFSAFAALIHDLIRLITRR